MKNSYIRLSDNGYVETLSAITDTDHVECVFRTSEDHVVNETWQTDPMNPSICWRYKTPQELDDEKTARAVELDEPKKAFAALIEQLWDNSTELQAAFSDANAQKQDAVQRYKNKINGS